ncbi:CAP domain-containing protein [Bacillus massiliigorillae]|uniref:CAP domain-containing protein n=1 Tax=Bacillus massiliigorillae TaxID=1243664 RepID=UPI0003A7722C|nr:CAP domain-containing protein [Bacillus massiliigorillae]
MNKKFLFTLATAATVTFTGFGAMNADAASNISTNTVQYEKVQSVVQNCKDGKVTTKVVVKPIVITNSTVNPCPNTKPEVKPEVKPENKPEVKPENKPETKPETKPEVTPPTTTPDSSKPEVDNSKPEQEKPSTSVSAYEQKVVELTNAERAKQGLKPLTLDVELSKVARIKSQDMKDKNYFDHNSPTYGSPFDMMKKFGISYNYAGENIAQGQRSPEEVVKAWMNSQGHRENIMNPNYTHIGIGHVADNNYWTQMFIGK